MFCMWEPKVYSLIKTEDFELSYIFHFLLPYCQISWMWDRIKTAMLCFLQLFFKNRHASAHTISFFPTEWQRKQAQGEEHRWWLFHKKIFVHTALTWAPSTHAKTSSIHSTTHINVAGIECSNLNTHSTQKYIKWVTIGMLPEKN